MSVKSDTCKSSSGFFLQAICRKMINPHPTTNQKEVTDTYE